ncbi:MAG: class I SAM-dependent methyltransferase [Planctomycetota bacterium]
MPVLAEVFAGPTRAFLRDAAPGRHEMVLDLGCGPGDSTLFLADVLDCAHAVGLDSSQSFIARAQARETERVSFVRHDVTSTPFPVGPADLVFCRFLLTHLKKPLDIVSTWPSQLKPAGRLLIQEVEAIETANDTFATYMGIVEAMLEAQSNRLYLGSALHAMEDPAGLRRLMSRTSRLPVTTGDAATMFSLNVENWRHQPFIQEHYSGAAIEEMWTLREVAFERV